MLSKVKGPACPHCGCQDSAEIDRSQAIITLPDGRRRTEKQSRRRCNHCGETWWVARKRADRRVIYRPVVCPNCGSKKTVIARTAKPIRYHKCKTCNRPFSSVEPAG